MLNGDERALKALLTEYHNYLVVVGMRYLNDKQRVNDVIHDVLADLWNSKKDIELKAGAKSFLRGAVINKCLAIIRKEQRIDLVEEQDLNIVDHQPTPDRVLEGKSLKEEVDRLIDSLPEKCKVVFVKSRIEGKSHREISDELEISKKTIENHMTKALKTLRSGLKEKELLTIVLMILANA